MAFALGIVITLVLGALAFILVTKMFVLLAAVAWQLLPALITVWFIVFILSRMVKSLFR